VLLQGKAGWTQPLPKELQIFAEISHLKFITDASLGIADSEVKPTIVPFRICVVLKQ